MQRRLRSVGVCGGLVLSLGLSACGSDVPTKAEFTEAVKKSIGNDATTSLTKVGVDKKKVTVIIDDFIGCVYDKLKSKPDLLTAVNDGAETESAQASITKYASDCSAKLSADTLAAATKG